MEVFHILVLVCMVTLSQCKLIEWKAENYPNPKENPAECGRRPGVPSMVCDPNGIISTESADFLDHILVNFPNDTMCPCSTYECEKGGTNKGYIMAVALVRKLERPANLPNTVEVRTNLVREFAFSLLRNYWKWGRCAEMTIIVFSKDDGILMTLSDNTPRYYLTERITLAIQKELARFFQEGGNVGQGLHYLTINYRRVLDKENYLPIMFSDVSSAANMVAISFITSLFTTMLLKMFC